MNSKLLELKAKICGFEHVSKKLYKPISRTHGERKQSLRYKKHLIGITAREHMIAYGLLRGKLYSKIEPKCGKHNPLNTRKVLEIVHQHVNPWETKNWTMEKLQKLTEVQK